MLQANVHVLANQFSKWLLVSPQQITAAAGRKKKVSRCKLSLSRQEGPYWGGHLHGLFSEGGCFGFIPTHTLTFKCKLKHIVQRRLSANWQAPNKHTSDAWRRIIPPPHPASFLWNTTPVTPAWWKSDSAPEWYVALCSSVALTQKSLIVHSVRWIPLASLLKAFWNQVLELTSMKHQPQNTSKSFWFPRRVLALFFPLIFSLTANEIIIRNGSYN